MFYKSLPANCTQPRQIGNKYLTPFCSNHVQISSTTLQAWQMPTMSYQKTQNISSFVFQDGLPQMPVKIRAFPKQLWQWEGGDLGERWGTDQDYLLGCASSACCRTDNALLLVSLKSDRLFLGVFYSALLSCCCSAYLNVAHFLDAISTMLTTFTAM